MKSCLFLCVAIWSCLIAGCAKTVPSCGDPRSTALVKEIVYDAMKHRAATLALPAPTLDRLLQSLTVRLDLILTTAEDTRIHRYTCESQLLVTVAGSVDDIASVLSVEARNAGVSVEGDQLKGKIFFSSQNTDDTQEHVISLRGHVPVANAAVDLALASLKREVALPTDLVNTDDAQLAAKRLMDAAFDAYDRQQQCWRNRQDPYCTRVDRADFIQVNGERRLYLLAVGDMLDSQGEDNGSHPDPGRVAAFIVTLPNAKPAMLAYDTRIGIGSFGRAPRDWQLVQVGAQHWGWMNTSGTCHQGYCSSDYYVLSDRQTNIKNLTAFSATIDDSGACSTQDCERRATTISTQLSFDRQAKDQQHFPLKIALRGLDQGKDVIPSTMTIPFDEQKGVYPAPALLGATRD